MWFIQCDRLKVVTTILFVCFFHRDTPAASEIGSKTGRSKASSRFPRLGRSSGREARNPEPQSGDLWLSIQTVYIERERENDLWPDHWIVGSRRSVVLTFRTEAQFYKTQPLFPLWKYMEIKWVEELESNRILFCFSLSVVVVMVELSVTTVPSILLQTSSKEGRT